MSNLNKYDLVKSVSINKLNKPFDENRCSDISYFCFQGLNTRMKHKIIWNRLQTSCDNETSENRTG